jgi:hypothetical protein
MDYMNRIKQLLLASFVVIIVASTNAQAKTIITCSGGHTFIDVQLSNGEWSCWEATTSCSGEWSFTIERANTGIIVNGGGTTPTTATTAVPATSRRQPIPSSFAGQQPNTPIDPQSSNALSVLTHLRQTDLKFSYRVPDSMHTAYLNRVHRQPRGTVTVSYEQLQPWLAAGLSNGNIAPTPQAFGICPGSTYPNPLPNGTTACYPCLGCHPCGDSFCDNGNAIFNQADLASNATALGYKVAGGKIVPPKPGAVSTRPAD